MTKIRNFLLRTLLFFLILTISMALNAQDNMKIKGKLYSDNTAVEIIVENGIIMAIQSLADDNASDQFPIISPGFIDL